MTTTPTMPTANKDQPPLLLLSDPRIFQYFPVEENRLRSMAQNVSLAAMCRLCDLASRLYDFVPDEETGGLQAKFKSPAHELACRFVNWLEEKASSIWNFFYEGSAEEVELVTDGAIPLHAICDRARDIFVDFERTWWQCIEPDCRKTVSPPEATNLRCPECGGSLYLMR